VTQIFKVTIVNISGLGKFSILDYANYFITILVDDTDTKAKKAIIMLNLFLL
jgi:hypothetical protein